MAGDESISNSDCSLRISAVIQIFAKFSIDRLDSDWYKVVWDSDFTEIDPLPVPFEELHQDTDWLRLLTESYEICKDWITAGEEGDESTAFWVSLVEHDVNLKGFIALAYHFINKGLSRSSTVHEKELAIRAISFYFALLRIPGSNAFKVFHPSPYQLAVDVCKLAPQLCPSPRKRKRRNSGFSCASSQSSRSSKRYKENDDEKPGRGRKKKKLCKGAASEGEEDNIDNESEEGESDDESVFDNRDIQMLIALLHSVLSDLLLVLDKFSLKACEQSKQHTIQRLAELTRLETDFSNLSVVASLTQDSYLNSPSINAIAHLGYRGLNKMCSGVHGDISKIHLLVLKYILPNLLLTQGYSAGSQTIPRATQVIKDHSVEFVLYSLRSLGDTGTEGIYILLQHMCTKVIDKAEYRAKVSQAIVSILNNLPKTVYNRMIKWLQKYSRNSKINFRLFGVEILALILTDSHYRTVSNESNSKTTAKFSHLNLLSIIIERCSDKSSSVRAKALSILANCVQSSDPQMQNAIQLLFSPKPTDKVASEDKTNRRTSKKDKKGKAVQAENEESMEVEEENSNKENEENMGEDGENVESDNKEKGDVGEDEGNADKEDEAKDNQELGDGDKNDDSENEAEIIENEITIYPTAESSIEMMCRRASDEKVNVRKSAVQVLESILKMDENYLIKSNIEVLQHHCMDSALLVRKQSIQSLTSLLQNYPSNKLLQQIWMEGLLPLVLDRETTAQEKCMDALETIILSNIVAYKHSKTPHHSMAWDILTLISDNEHQDARRYLQKACCFWTRHNHIRPNFLTCLQSHISTEHDQAAWMLLAELAVFLPLKNPEFVLDYWSDNSSHQLKSTLQKVVTVIGCAAKFIPQTRLQDLIEEFESQLRSFTTSLELISVILVTLTKLWEQIGKTTTRSSNKVENFCVELLKACDKFLSAVILENNKQINHETTEKIILHLHTLGEAAQLCPNRIPKRLFLVIQSLIASPCIQSQATKDYDPTQTDLPNSQPASQPLSQFNGSVMNSKVRAHAFVSLGKLCLQNEDLAKKCVPALGRELETSDDALIRNNIVVIMSDLCIRYTTLVDRYIINITACLKDSSPLVRRQTLMLLTHLLQEDYIKWKGSLFFRFIVTLVDEDPEIQTLAEFCLLQILLQRNPLMFFHHFVECVFYFNSYQGHSTYNKFVQSEREVQLFTMKDVTLQKKRVRLYKFMLENMADEHRFQITAKLVQEILGGIVDGMIPLNQDSQSLVQDALVALTCEEIKLSSLRVSPQEELEDGDVAAAVMATAKKTLITQVVKKNVIENIVPVVIALKHMLEEQKSPILRDLMAFLKELMKDYKNEVKDILAADKQLANEIEFDMRRYDQQQEEEKRRERRKSVVTPAAENVPTEEEMATPVRKLTTREAVLTSTKRAVAVARKLREERKSHSSPATPLAGGKKVSEELSVRIERLSIETIDKATTGKTPEASRKSASPSTPKTHRVRVKKSLSPMIQNSCRDVSVRLERLEPEVLEKSLSNAKEKATDPDPVLKSTKVEPITPPKNDENKVEEGSPAATTPLKPINLFPQVLLRAISTPHAVIENITFHSNSDISLNPPSPISVEETSPKNNVVEDSHMVLHVKSPEEPSTKRVWKVRTRSSPRVSLSKKKDS